MRRCNILNTIPVLISNENLHKGYRCGGANDKLVGKIEERHVGYN